MHYGEAPLAVPKERDTIWKQECIRVGCVPPACWPYPSTGQGEGVHPSMHWAGGGVSQHALGRGVCILACTGQGGFFPGGCLLKEVSSQDEGDVADTPLWGDRHLRKHNLRKLRLRAVIRGVTFLCKRNTVPIFRWHHLRVAWTRFNQMKVFLWSD